jgi:hypothetical protein
MLEEVLVPMYFFHRYQMEAAVKVVGGLDYTYALRGDGQQPTSFIDPRTQQKALDAILATVTPESLALPENVLELIPPRPLGYRRSNELIKLRTGLTFDALGAAETSANMAFGFLFNPARASRLVEYHARDSKQPGLGKVIDTTFEKTWKMSKSGDYHGEIGRTVDMVVLRNLMGLAVNDNASEQARAIAMYKIDELNKWITSAYANEKNEGQRAHLFYASNEISEFKKNPERFKKFEMLTPPAGSPIGMDELGCGH